MKNFDHDDHRAPDILYLHDPPILPRAQLRIQTAPRTVAPAAQKGRNDGFVHQLDQRRIVVGAVNLDLVQRLHIQHRLDEAPGHREHFGRIYDEHPEQRLGVVILLHRRNELEQLGGRNIYLDDLPPKNDEDVLNTTKHDKRKRYDHVPNNI